MVTRSQIRDVALAARKAGPEVNTPLGDTSFVVCTYLSSTRYRTHTHYRLIDAQGHTAVGGHTNIDTFAEIAERWMTNHSEVK